MFTFGGFMYDYFCFVKYILSFIVCCCAILFDVIILFDVPFNLVYFFRLTKHFF